MRRGTVGLEKLSEKGYERLSEHVFGPIQKPKWAEEPLFCGPEGYTLGASETFQTVSEEEFCELRLDGVLRGGPVEQKGHSANFALTAFSEVQLRVVECRSVTKVMSSSCSQPSPTKE